MLTAKEPEGGNFVLVPQGTHLGACFLVADIGQQETSYGMKHKLVMGWELPKEMIDIEGEKKPMIVYNTYTVSLSEKANLRRDLESWRGREFTAEELKGFDVFNVMGAPCMMSIVHKTVGDKTYANIASVSALPKGMEGEKVTRLLKYSPDDPEQLSELPEWIQKKIGVSNGFDESENPAHGVPQGGGGFDSDIPFDQANYKVY